MAEKTYYNFTTPIGRLVSGSPSSFRTTNQLGEQLTYKSGVNKGEPKREYSLGVAFRKTQSDVPAFIRELRGYAAQEWPRLFDGDLNCLFDDFAGKITDGDSTKMNKKQKRPCDNPNWQGCWIVWFTSDREPQCVSHGAGKIIPASGIKTGYYVRISASTCKNTGDTPGMYMNLEGVELSGYGPEIETRPDPRDAFRENQAAVVPEGMSAVPVSDGEAPVPSEPPPPPIPPGNGETRAGSKVLYQGVTYERDQLIKRGWTEAQVAALPTA